MWSSYGYGFSQQLRRVRERRGVSQQVLADISGVSRSQISNLDAMKMAYTPWRTRNYPRCTSWRWL
ncbi:helix-turn-helix transcriptional regulator [Corynebacterium accolens]|uniref:helix-turn-helix domain-containing protein n=1 Tax=Corynebacterium accolens TaxID=38284 RepID=UPI0030806141